MQPNMRQVGAIAAPLLTYSLTTDPLPVQASPSETSPAIATLTFVVSCPKSTGSATVAAIEIVLPVDTGGTEDASNLCMTAPPLSSAAISSSDGSEWTQTSAGAPGAFYFTPPNDSILVAGQSLTIEFTGIEVNPLVGTALVTINEWAAKGTATPTSPDDGPPSGQQLIAVAKFPYGFYAGNFTSNKPMVNNGEKPVLSWTGSSNATYLMLYESNVVDVSDVQSWSPPNGLTQMTTFILQVSAQQEGQTATMDFSLTIEVANPSLTAQDLTVLKTSTLKGAVSVGIQGTPADLMVNGNVQSQGTMTTGGKLTAQSDASVAGALNVTGGATLASTLNVNGAVSIGNTLTVSGFTRFTGGLITMGLTAGGPVSIFGLSQKLNPGTYTAATDGFVVGTVYPLSGAVFYDLTIYGFNNVMRVQASGGGTFVAVPNSGNSYWVNTSGMFILPVPAGNTFTLGLINPVVSNAPMPYYAFYWYPYGSVPLTATPAPTATQTTSRKRKVSKKPAARKAATKKRATSKKPASKKKPVNKKSGKRSTTR